MNILHLDTDDIDNPLAGGQSVRTYEINRRLAASHNITVLTSTFRGAQKEVVRSGIRYLRTGFRIPFSGLSPHLSFLLMSCLKIRQLDHDLLVEEFTPPAGFTLAHFFSTKPVVTLVQWYSFEDWTRRYRLPFEKMMVRYGNLLKAKNFIVQTDQMAARIRKLFPWADIVKIPCGLNKSDFSPAPDSELKKKFGKYVLYLGRLDISDKGLDLLLEAWSKMAKFKPVPLVIAGDGEDRIYLEREIRRRQLSKIIHLVGHVKDYEKKRLISSCCFMVMPSRRETFGLAALEGMALGKTVVAFDIDNLNELLKPYHSVLVKRFDTSEFAQAVLTLWGDDSALSQLGEKSREKALFYTWDNLARQQENFYIKVAEKELK